MLKTPGLICKEKTCLSNAQENETIDDLIFLCKKAVQPIGQQAEKQRVGRAEAGALAKNPIQRGGVVLRPDGGDGVADTGFHCRGTDIVLGTDFCIECFCDLADSLCSAERGSIQSEGTRSSA